METFLVTVLVIGMAVFNLSAATHYVSLESPNPTPPFTNWMTAARVIQDAVDAAKPGDTVLVTNGVYEVGEREAPVIVSDFLGTPPGPNRVVVTNSITLRSFNGPSVTTIKGMEVRDASGVDGGIRCVVLRSNAVLSGFTLTKGWGGWMGGGVWCESFGMVTNCILSRNSAEMGAGAWGGTLWNCTLADNIAVGGGWFDGVGGGVDESILYNCTLNANWASYGGGGAHGSTLHNCTLTDNSTDGWGGGASGCTLYSCTLTGNSATVGVGTGGGANWSTLYNCTVTGNSAPYGGGAYGGTLYNCTVTGNSALHDGGGVSSSMVYNCIAYYNTAANGANYFTGRHPWDTNKVVRTLLHYSCTTPLPTNGVGNVVGPPLFMDMAAGDFRLREDSPCIDAAMNLVGFSATLTNEWGDVSVISYNHEPTDILGNTRFIDGNGDGKMAWDIGAYEFNSFKPPRFSVIPQRTPTGWRFTITGEPKNWIGLQSSSDLKGWWDLKPPEFVGDDGVCELTDENTGPKVMFYRAVVP